MDAKQSAQAAQELQGWARAVLLSFALVLLIVFVWKAPKKLVLATVLFLGPLAATHRADLGDPTAEVSSRVESWVDGLTGELDG